MPNIYKLKPEHAKKFGEIAKKWIQNAMSTKPMDETDREICRKSIKKMYKLANLPQPKNIIFVPSPFVLRFASGYAAAFFYLRKNKKLNRVAATDAATRAATEAATLAATDDATRAEFNKYYRFSAPKVNDFFSACARLSDRLNRGASQWSGINAYFDFFENVAKIDIDWTKYEPYREMISHCCRYAIHSDFAMVCDRPIKLLVDELNLPHCEDGPFCEWSDGSAIYAIHGVYVPRWLIEFPESLTIAKIEVEQNMEVQRIMIEKFGVDKYISEQKGEIIDEDNVGLEGSSDRILIRTKNNMQWLICSDGSTGRIYHIAVSRDVSTCKEAHKEICGFDEERIIAEA